MAYQKNIIYLIFAAIIFSCAFICNAHEKEVDNERPFTYVDGKGEGPDNWGELDPKWRVCKTGKLQSPIDLFNKRVTVHTGLGQLKRNYKPAPAVLKNRGHDIMVEWKGNAGGIKINGSLYKLLQCHWHSPSEHTINGKRYNMELHMVHQNADKGNAVIGILYKFGRPDPFLSKLLQQIKKIDAKPENLGIINPREIKFGSRKYYRYNGSLTVPPCTEGVLWTLLKKVRTVSKEQVHALRNAVHDGFEENSRPTQQQHGRPLYLYTPKDL